MCKLDLKDAYFCIPLAEELKKFVRFYWDGELYQFLWCMLWTCSSPLLFHETIEDSNCLFSENRHFNHNLSGPYALNWKDSRECLDASPYSDPPITRAGVCDKSKEVGNDPLTGDEVSGYGNYLQRDDCLSSRRETPKSEITMFRLVSAQKCQFYSCQFYSQQSRLSFQHD